LSGERGCAGLECEQFYRAPAERRQIDHFVPAKDVSYRCVRRLQLDGSLGRHGDPRRRRAHFELDVDRITLVHIEGQLLNCGRLKSGEFSGNCVVPRLYTDECVIPFAIGSLHARGVRRDVA